MPSTKKKLIPKKVNKLTEASPMPEMAVPWHYENAVEPTPLADAVDNPPATRDLLPNTSSRYSWRCYLTAAVIFLFPFIVFPWSASLHEFSKQTFLALLVGAGLLLVLWHMRRQGSFDLLPRHLVLPLGFLALIVTLVGIGRSQFPYLYFFGSGGSEGASWFTLFLLASWLLLTFHAGRETSRLPYLALLWSGSILSLITLISLWGFNVYGAWAAPGFNPASTTTIVSLLAVATLILGLGRFLEASASRTRWFLLLLGLPPAVLLLGTGFRVAWIVTAVGLGVLALLRVKSKKAISPVILVAFLIALILAVKPFISFLRTPIEVGPSYGETVSILKAALAEHKLLGTGAASFGLEYLRFRSLPILQTPFWNLAFDWGYSGVLTLLVHHGLVGSALLLIVVVSVLCMAFWKACKTREAQSYLPALTATGVALFVGAFLAPTTLSFSFFFVTILGLILASTTRPWSAPFTGASRLGPSLGITLLIIVACGVLIIQGMRGISEAVIAQGVRIAAADLARGEQRIVLGTRLDPLQDGALRTLSEVRRLRLRELLNQPAPQEDQQAALQRLRDLADGTLNAARRATALAPGVAANWAIFGNAYLDIASFTQGASSAAVEAFEKALALSPSDPMLLVNLGVSRALAAQGIDGEEGTRLNSSAQEALEQAAKLRPALPLAHLELARFYGQKKQIEEALTAYRNAEVILPQDPALRYEVGLLLFGNDRKEEAARELEAAVKLAPNFSNARWYLAQIYEEAGNTTGAIEQIQKVIELNPENQQAKDRLSALQAPPTKTHKK